MQITWYGHAAFLIETGATRIILDPYTSPDAGTYQPINDSADVVVVSHENQRYHSGLSQIEEPFEVVKGLEIPVDGVEVAGIRFKALPVFETPEKLPGDEVTIIHFDAEGLHVAFLGDLGHALDPEELDQLGHPDVVLVPAGGPPTIDYPLIPDLISKLKPNIIIPMHYWTPKINLRIQPVERFLEVLPSWPVDRLNSSTVELNKGQLASNRINLLQSAR